MILLAQQAIADNGWDGRWVVYGLVFGFIVLGIYFALVGLVEFIEGSNEVDSKNRHG